MLLLACNGALAVGEVDGSKHPDWDRGVEAIQRRDWPAAIQDFSSVIKGEPDNAGAYNWLAYAYRKSGNVQTAFKYYREALRLDPKHLGAHEYIGEAYLMVGDKARAREHLAILEKLCGRNCEEYKDLAKAIAAAR